MMDDCMRCGTKAVIKQFDGTSLNSHRWCPKCGLRWMASRHAGRGLLVKADRRWGWRLAPKGTLRTYGEAA